MNADEYEARLRDVVIKAVEHYYEATMTGGNGEGWDLGALAVARSDALTAYADWLRLRAVAGGWCGRSDPYDKDDLNDCVSLGFPVWEYCPRCAAQQKIAEIVAAEGGTG